MMKKISIIFFFSLLLLLFACCSNSGLVDMSEPAETWETTIMPGDETSPMPYSETVTPVPEIDSAVEFLNLPDVIEKVTAVYDTKFDNYPEKIEPGQYYYGKLKANYSTDWPYRLLKLDREQSRCLLSASDITDINYIQSECLPLMLSWDRISVIDDFSHSASNCAYMAYYYYLDDSTVIIVNDGAKAYDKAYKNDDSAWILVIPKGEEKTYPFSIPPEGTFVSYKDHNPGTYDFYCSFYYERLRNYLMRDSASVPIVRPSYVYPGYMTDYVEWIEWRESHPAEYEQWKQSAFFTQKRVVSQNIASHGSNFRIYNIDWLSHFNNGKEPPEANPAELALLPYFYLEIKQYGILSEELLEFVNWQNWSDYFSEVFFSKEDVDMLYSGNDDQVRKHFLCKKIWYYEGSFYTCEQVIYELPPYEIAVMFTPEEFERFMDQNNMYYYLKTGSSRDADRIMRMFGAWEVYETISKEDAGELTVQSAEREVNGFIELYRMFRYSPEALAGEPVSQIFPEIFRNDGYGEYFYSTNNILFRELREQIRSIVAPEARPGVNSLLKSRYDGQFYTYEDDTGDLLIAISIRPIFYNGAIEMFGENFKLADHIRIIRSDSEHAEAELTARKRSGEGTVSYSIEFFKVNGKWYISGGTIFDLISPVL